MEREERCDVQLVSAVASSPGLGTRNANSGAALPANQAERRAVSNVQQRVTEIPGVQREMR